MNILQKIFNDHYEEIQYILNPRPVVMENITKMVNCGDPSFGGAMFACPHCTAFKFVPFRCHSKFCPSCGNKYTIERSTKMSFKLIRCTHRHIVFTLDKRLWPLFLDDRSLLDCLFQAVREVILNFFFELNKSKNFVPGFVCVLHTFGRPLTWNPHIHCLLSEGGLSDDGVWRKVTYFDYTYLRTSFQTVLLNLLLKRIGPSFKILKASCYKDYKDGFYVYAKPNLCDPDTVIKYISRYLGRPVIATSRIDAYDGEFVTFHYNKHEDNSFVREKLPALDFIKLLIQHIPEKHFKMTRYYGLYARHRDIDNSLQKTVPKFKHKIFLDFNKWRTLFLLSFGYDPLQCPHCHHKMEFVELFYNHKPVSLVELYERTMATYRCRSSGKFA